MRSFGACAAPTAPMMSASPVPAMTLFSKVSPPRPVRAAGPDGPASPRNRNKNHLRPAQSNSLYQGTGRRQETRKFLTLMSGNACIVFVTILQSGINRRSPVRSAILRALAALAIVTAFGIAPAAAQTGQMFGELVGKV